MKNKFWTAHKNYAEFEQMALIEYLQEQGFGRLYIDKHNYFIARVQNHIIRRTDETRIKELILDALSKAGEDRKVLEQFHIDAKRLINTETLALLHEIQASHMRDTSTTAYFYFINGIVEVNEQTINIVPYDTLSSTQNIYETQIIDKNVSILNEHSEFETFLFNAMGKDKRRFESMMSALGYLLHRYHNPTTTKAIIFTDERHGNSNEAHGGTGKSLVTKALGYLRNAVNEDGKLFKPNKSFAYQKLDTDTDLICINDVSSEFDLEPFYSALTDGITIEKKYETAYYIPSELLPKMLISTNYVVLGKSGYTDERRRQEIEFSDYYGRNRRPDLEFGHYFFKDWDTLEWNRFFTFMFKCVQCYLNNGLLTYEQVSIPYKRLVSKTWAGFAEFAMKRLPEMIGKRTLKGDLFAIYKQWERSEGEYFPQLSQRMFTSWIKEYCTTYGYKAIEKDANGKSYITIER